MNTTVKITDKNDKVTYANMKTHSNILTLEFKLDKNNSVMTIFHLLGHIKELKIDQIPDCLYPLDPSENE